MGIKLDTPSSGISAGSVVCSLREALDVEANDMADAVGLDISAYYKKERDEQRFTDDEIASLATPLGIREDVLFLHLLSKMCPDGPQGVDILIEAAKIDHWIKTKLLKG
jgi:transcriptional regulator with XRE-family HTH domain